MSLNEAANVAFAEGLKAVEGGHLKSALEMFTRACALNPDEARFQGYRAWAQYHSPVSHESQIEQAAHRDDCRLRILAALDQTENYDPLYVLLGTIYMGEQDSEAAALAFQKALEINPANNGALLGLQAAKRRSEPGQAFDIDRFAAQTIPSPQPPTFTQNRIMPSTVRATNEDLLVKGDTVRNSNVFSTARLRSQIDELKRARNQDRSQFEDIHRNQNEELRRLKDQYEANIGRLKHQISLVTDEKQTIRDEFNQARETLATEKERISALANEQDQAVTALNETHHSIRDQIQQAKSDAQERDDFHHAEIKEINTAKKQLLGELDHSQSKIIDLEDSLGLEKEQIQAFHENIEDLSREFSEATSRYEQEIEEREYEREKVVQKANQDKAELRQQIEDLQQAHQSGIQSSHERDLEIQSLRHKSEEIENELAKKTEDLKTTEKELKAKLVVLQHQTTENETKRGELSEREAQLAELQDNLDKAQQELSSKQNAIDELDLRLDDANTAVSRINNELAASQAEVAHLREDRRDAEVRQSWIQKAELQLENRQDQIESLSSDLNSARGQINRLENDHTQQKRDCEALLLKVEELKTEVTLGPSEEDLDEFKRKLERTRLDLDRSKKQVETGKKRIDDIEHHRSQDQAHIHELKTESDERRAELQQLKLDRERQDIEKGGILSQIKDLQTEASLRPSKNEIDGLRKDLDESRKNLGVERNRYEDAQVCIEKLEQDGKEIVEALGQEQASRLKTIQGDYEERFTTQQHDNRNRLAQLEAGHEKTVRAIAEDSAGKIQSLQDENITYRTEIQTLKGHDLRHSQGLEALEHRSKVQEDENEELKSQIEVLQQHVSNLPSKNEVEVIRGQFEKSQSDLNDTRARIEEERVRIEELERLILDEHQKLMDFEKQSLHDKSFIDQAKAQREVLEEKYAKTAGTLTTVLNSIQSQLDSERARAQKHKEQNATTITHLSSEKDELGAELRETYKLLEDSRAQLGFIQKGQAHNKKEFDEKFQEQARERDDLKNQLDQETAALRAQIEDNDVLHLSSVESLNGDHSLKVEELESALEAQEAFNHSQLQTQREEEFRSKEKDLSGKLDKQALLVFEIKDDFDRKQGALTKEISTLHEALAFANDQLTDKTQEIEDLLEEQDVLVSKHSDARKQYARAQDETRNARSALDSADAKLGEPGGSEHEHLSISQELQGEGKQAQEKLIQSRATEKDRKAALDAYEEQLFRLDSELHETTTKLKDAQEAQAAQSTELVRAKAAVEGLNTLKSEQEKLAQLRDQLKDTLQALGDVKHEEAASSRSIEKIKIEESSKNERLQAEIHELKKVAEQTLEEKATAEIALLEAQAQFEQLDPDHESVFERANDDLDAARSRLAAVESASARKQGELLQQLEDAEQEIRQLRELDQENQSILAARTQEMDAAKNAPEQDVRNQLLSARSEIANAKAQAQQVKNQLAEELADLGRELGEAKRARMQVEQTFVSQFQRLELQYQSRVSELKARFEHQLKMSSGPAKIDEFVASSEQARLDVPDLAEQSGLDVPMKFSSELPIQLSDFDKLEVSRTVPAPASELIGRPPPPPPAEENYAEIESSDVERASVAAIKPPAPSSGITTASKQNFASVEALLSALDLPFPELDESAPPQELPDESMFDDEAESSPSRLDAKSSASDGPEIESDEKEDANPAAQEPRPPGRIKAFLNRLSGITVESDRPPGSSSSEDHERSDRHHVRLRMSFDNGEDYHVARVRDISGTGVYLETAEPQPLGAELTLSPLGMADFEELEFKAKVVRSKQYSPHAFGKDPPGMGLRFAPMRDKVRKKLLFLVRQLEERELREGGKLDPFFGVKIPENEGQSETQPMPIRILGGGLRAGDIAYHLARHGIAIHLGSVEDQSVDGAIAQAQSRFDADTACGLLNKADAAKRMRLITTSDKNIDISKATVVIEAVADPLSIKKAVIRQLEKKIPRNCTIITMVSQGHIVTSIADGLRHPDRLCGMHFISTTQSDGLVEIVRGKLSSETTIQVAAQLARGIDLKPIVIADEHGFLIHRILGFYFNEAGHLIEEGVSFEAIDEVSKGFGFNKGPLQLMDELGINFVRKNAEILESAFGARAKVPSSLLAIANSDRQGRNSGNGFYRYIDGQMRGIDPDAYLDCGRSEQGSHDALSEEEIRDRLLLTMINEAARSIGDCIIDSPGTLDMAMIMACSFPAFRKGVLHYADTLRPTSVLSHLEELEEKHGPRFMPALYLRRLAEDDALFYQTQ